MKGEKQVVTRLTKNTLILYARMFITIFISLYTTRLVLAALGTEDFGLFTLIGGAIAMMTFLNAAMSSATQRFMSFAHGEGDYQKQTNIFNISVLLHLIIGVLLVILLEVVGYFLFESILNIDPSRLDAAKFIFQFLIISTFFTVIAVPYEAVVNAHENMLFVAITSIIETILKLCVAIYISYSSYDKLISYGLLMASITIILLFIRGLYCHKKYDEVRINIRKYFDRSLFKEMNSFAGWSFLGSSTSMITHYGQGVLLNMFFGTTINAAQGVSNQISGQLEGFSTNMLKALNPIIVKSEGAKKRSQMLQFSLTGSKISFILLALFAIPLMLEIDYIFTLWLKDPPEFAIIFTILLLIRKLIAQLFITISTSINATGNIKEKQIAGTILNFFPLIVSYYFFTLNYSPTFLYIIFIIVEVIRGSYTLYFAEKYCSLSIRYFLKDVLIPFLIVTPLIALIVNALLFSINNELFRFLFKFILFFILFLLAVYFIIFNKKEKFIFKSLISTILLKLK